jgi:hypothetical protein
VRSVSVQVRPPGEARALRGARWATGAALLVGVVSACARQGTPTGGPEDRRPPVVVATSPASFDTVRDLNAPIRFEFDERISERPSSGTLEELVTISPRSGAVRVSSGRRTIEVRVDGGLRPGLVYRVTLQAAVSDLFSNTLGDPFELVFTTGGDVVPTTLAGQVWDRVTGRGVGPTTIHAVSEDSLVHQSVAEADGIYAFRYLPAGTFRIVAFEDRDRDAEVGAAETQGSAPVTLAAGDTVLLDVSILAPDTLPAVLLDATALDSMTVVAAFDDFLEPSVDVSAVEVQLAREEGGAPGIARLLHEAEYVAYREAIADSLGVPDAPDAAVITTDTGAVVPTDTGAVVDTTVPPPPDPAPRPALDARLPPDLRPLQGGAPGPIEGTDRVVPGRRLVALLDAPILRDVEYTVRAASVVNVNGLAGGGGEATLVFETPPDTVVADTLTGDTLSVDTLGVDTLSIDTLSVDTLGVDTVRVDTLLALGGARDR